MDESPQFSLSIQITVVILRIHANNLNHWDHDQFLMYCCQISGHVITTSQQTTVRIKAALKAVLYILLFFLGGG